ncbi:uncharacterized protein KY384_004224 [Bacidia gigantensis]|uniref:uncharacterized protein n=1 Tax=Bacidia gigantensis TaxID=2732470 RepID=UPI001D047282|nr:uncharacterized protein KY384_004224 [Bacidia gigantensis]KAG8530867.1 hypothetical protein KY384_004224 [Bacidia gigantensis]
MARMKHIHGMPYVLHHFFSSILPISAPTASITHWSCGHQTGKIHLIKAWPNFEPSKHQRKGSPEDCEAPVTEIGSPNIKNQRQFKDINRLNL